MTCSYFHDAVKKRHVINKSRVILSGTVHALLLTADSQLRKRKIKNEFSRRYRKRKLRFYRLNCIWIFEMCQYKLREYFYALQQSI